MNPPHSLIRNVGRSTIRKRRLYTNSNNSVLRGDRGNLTTSHHYCPMRIWLTPSSSYSSIPIFKSIPNTCTNSSATSVSLQLKLGCGEKMNTSTLSRSKYHLSRYFSVQLPTTRRSQSSGPPKNKNDAIDIPKSVMSTVTMTGQGTGEGASPSENDDNDHGTTTTTAIGSKGHHSIIPEIMQRMTSASTEIEMDRRCLFRYLQLKQFTTEEINQIFDKIRIHGLARIDQDEHGMMDEEEDSTNVPTSSKGASESIHRHIDEQISQGDEMGVISQADMTAFILGRIREIDANQMAMTIIDDNENDTVDDDKVDDRTSSIRQSQEEKEQQMITYAKVEAHKAMNLLLGERSIPAASTFYSRTMTKTEFQTKLESLATELDTSKTIPLSASMLLVGSSVGIIIPIMPSVVANLGLSAGQYGVVVSSFALAKLFANVPAAVLVEKHGRKPYLVYSLVVISMGVGGIGLASQFEHLIVCRTLTGLGVSLLSTAATLTIADCSTPLNRARTMAPMMSGFAAGTALGPAVGGLLADRVGVSSTFYLVGGIYLVLTAINKISLTETKMVPESEIPFPWRQENNKGGRKRRTRRRPKEGKDDGVMVSMQDAISQWSRLLANPKVRNVVMMNGFYWVALAGSQMTLLPLILTDPSGLAMSATRVGEVYMGMSLVQVLGNPTMAQLVDRMGKVPGIVTGCGLLSASMFALPFCTDIEHVAATLGCWSLGSTMLSTAPTAYISDHVQEKERAQAIALLRTAGDIGFLFGASSTGAVSDLFGMDVGMHTAASLLLTATGWFTARRWMDRLEAKKLRQR